MPFHQVSWQTVCANKVALFKDMESLLIQRGRVIDPATGVDAEMDVLLRDGRVVEVTLMTLSYPVRCSRTGPKARYARGISLGSYRRDPPPRKTGFDVKRLAIGLFKGVVS